MSTSTEIQAQLTEAENALEAARRRAAEPAKNVATMIERETAVLACERLTERLEAELGAVTAREERETAERLLRERQARKLELEESFSQGCDELARLIDVKARELEPLVETVRKRRDELLDMHNEHYKLLKTITGKTRIDPMEWLAYRASVVPMYGHKFEGVDESPLYGPLVAALYRALDLEQEAWLLRGVGLVPPTQERAVANDQQLQNRALQVVRDRNAR